MDRGTISKAISVAVFILAAADLVYLILKGYILSANAVGLVIQACSVGLMIWARITFGIRSFHARADTTEGKLVTNGPYRWLRHPIYASIIYFTWAAVFSHFVPDAIAATLLISLSLYVRMILEERFLRVVYKEYAAYCRRAKRVIPFIF